ncbi:MAG: hypothetical protein FJ319_12605 [SAR202 cluster bacterium]|nr:hypothetical protein [SAR202 cluster bacterium]
MLVDIHTHLYGGRKTVANLLSHLDLYGGGKSVVLPIAGGEVTAVRDHAWPNEEALAAVDEKPGQVFAFCHVNPFDRNALETISKLHATGKIKGLGEHKVKLPVDHPYSMEMYRLCGELGLPVLIHFDYSDHHNYNFPAFEGVLKALPGTTFIGHAMAYWSNVSADADSDYKSPAFKDYPEGKVVRGGLTDRWLSDYPNLYGDLSATSGFNAMARDEEFGAEFLARHRKKLMWGSDCPCPEGKGMVQPNGKFRQCLSERMLPVLRKLCSSKAHYEDITWHNAERLLKI